MISALGTLLHSITFVQHTRSKEGGQRPGPAGRATLLNRGYGAH